MKTIVDKEFGELKLDYDWIKESKQKIFEKNFDIEIIVEGNDNDETISEEQRISYRKFITENEKIITQVESSVVKYYQEFCEEMGFDKVSENEIADKVELTGVVFPMTLKKDDITIGFLFEADCDPEHGIGVKIKNGKIEASNQDILT